MVVGGVVGGVMGRCVYMYVSMGKDILSIPFSF